MKVFISRPTVIAPEFEEAHEGFHGFMISQGFSIRRLGGDSYSKKAPLMKVIELIHECCGAIVLGYPQTEFHHQAKRAITFQNDFRTVFPTPWNHIEGALAYARRLPTLVVANPGIQGGVFDHGITGESVIHLDLALANWFTTPQFQQPFAEWTAEVRSCAMNA